MAEFGSLYLPNEILLKILNEVTERKDVEALRCVNSSFCARLDPILFSVVKVDLSKTVIPQASNKMEALKSSHISPHVRQLDFHSLRPKALENTGALKTMYQKYRAQAAAQTIFLAALASWKNLTFVHFACWRDFFPELWHVLRKEGIRLEEVWVQYAIDDALMQYLASYSGLQSLKLLRFEARSSSSAENFRTKVLPQHRHSLHTLVLEPAEEGSSWSYGQHWVSHYEECRLLHYLHLCMDLDDMGAEANLVNTCLLFGHAHPCLSRLEISPSHARWGRYPRRQGCVVNGLYRRHDSQTAELIVNGVLNFKPPTRRRQYLQIIVNDEMFKSDGSQYRPDPDWDRAPYS